MGKNNRAEQNAYTRMRTKGSLTRLNTRQPPKKHSKNSKTRVTNMKMVPPPTPPHF